MKKNLIRIGLIGIILISIFIYYKHTYISLWGNNINKSQIIKAEIDTKNSKYTITDKEVILEIADELSEMKKLDKIEATNWPPTDRERSTKYRKISFKNEDGINYGGGFWVYNNQLLIDGNGYYWSIDTNIFELLDKSLNSIEADITFE